jgi:hypothetical protein
MSDKMEKGLAVAEQAILFAIWCNGDPNRTLADIRAAIRTLFGEEIDKELAKKYGDKQ